MYVICSYMFILLHLAPSYNPILEPALEHLQVCCCGSWALRLCKAGSSSRGVTFGTRIPFNGIKHPAMRNPQIELHYIGGFSSKPCLMTPEGTRTVIAKHEFKAKQQSFFRNVLKSWPALEDLSTPCTRLRCISIVSALARVLEGALWDSNIALLAVLHHLDHHGNIHFPSFSSPTYTMKFIEVFQV
jgi:hypothetical protein